MTRYDDELQRGMVLATRAAAASAELDAHTSRVGASRPVQPGTAPAGQDEDYRAAWNREVFASQMFWEWVKQHCRLITDRDLGVVLRVLAGEEERREES